MLLVRSRNSRGRSLPEIDSYFYLGKLLRAMASFVFLSVVHIACCFPRGSPPPQKSQPHSCQENRHRAMREVGPLHCVAASEATIIAVVSLRGSEGSNFVAGVMSCCGFFHSGPPFPSVESEKHSFLHTHTHTVRFRGKRQSEAKRSDPEDSPKGKYLGTDGTSMDAIAIVPIGATRVVNFILNAF